MLDLFSTGTVAKFNDKRLDDIGNSSSVLVVNLELSIAEEKGSDLNCNEMLN